MASTRIPLEVQASEVEDVFFAPAARQVACYYHRTQDLFSKQLAFYDVQTRRRTALLDLGKDLSAGYVDVSLDAGRVARIHSVPGQGSALNVWSLPDGKLLAEKWNPYPREKDPRRALENLTRELIWCAFLDRDRLLTVARNGQYDLWNVAERNGIYTVPAAPGRPRILEYDFFAHRPKNFALSHDRKTLALSNKNGFDLIDTATGRLLRSTPPLNVKGRPGNEWSLAFSPDGAQLAAKLNLFEADNRQHEYVLVWDVATGRQKALWPVEQNFNANGPIVWWGARHVVLNNGIRTEGHVFSLADGRFRSVVQRSGFGKLAGNSPDGQLWCATATAFQQRAEISATAVPEDHLWQPPPGGPGQPLPRWYVGPEGVSAEPGR
jgi:WD40 repeat protein